MQHEGKREASIQNYLRYCQIRGISLATRLQWSIVSAGASRDQAHNRLRIGFLGQK